jgi:hypothetical protein
VALVQTFGHMDVKGKQIVFQKAIFSKLKIKPSLFEPLGEFEGFSFLKGYLPLNTHQAIDLFVSFCGNDKKKTRSN